MFNCWRCGLKIPGPRRAIGPPSGSPQEMEMSFGVRRRAFVVALCSAAAGWRSVARAQPRPTVRRIGFLLPGFSGADAARILLDEFRRGLRELGWIEGQNLSISYR